MRGVSFWFFFSAICYLVAGIGLGGYMAGSKDFILAPVHGHLNLVGWVSFALFGLYYRVEPLVADSPLAITHFAIASLGLWLLVPGIALFELGITETVAALGGAITLIAILLFAFIVFKSRTAYQRTNK